MNFIFRLSGFLVVMFSWIMVVLPYYLSKDKRKVKVLSDIGALPKIGTILNMGLMFVSISQLLFWVYITSTFPLTSIIKAMIILFYASFHLLLAGFVHRGIDKDVHDMLTHIYFIFSLAGAYLLSDAFSVIDSDASNVLKTAILISILGMIFLYRYRRYILVELWHITFCSVWIVVIYFCIF